MSGAVPAGGKRGGECACGKPKSRATARCRACWLDGCPSVRAERSALAYLERHPRTVPAEGLLEVLRASGERVRAGSLARALERLERKGLACRVGTSWHARSLLPPNVTGRAARLADAAP